MAEPSQGQVVRPAILSEAEPITALAHGYRFLRARSRTVRGEAHAFYESLGYHRIKTQCAFGRALEE